MLPAIVEQSEVKRQREREKHSVGATELVKSNKNGTNVC